MRKVTVGKSNRLGRSPDNAICNGASPDSRDRHARFYERVAQAGAKSSNYYSCVRSTRTILRKGCTQHQNSQFYYSFGRSTRTILRKGCSANSNMLILLQIRAIDTKGSQSAPQECQFYYSFGRSTRTILRKGCSANSVNVDFTTVSRDRHARSYESVAFPRAFSGPWRPPDLRTKVSKASKAR